MSAIQTWFDALPASGKAWVTWQALLTTIEAMESFALHSSNPTFSSEYPNNSEQADIVAYLDASEQAAKAGLYMLHKLGDI